METWICHVCGKKRPDKKISVLSTKKDLHGVEVQQNVRYCNDDPQCVEGAKQINWIPEDAE